MLEVRSITKSFKENKVLDQVSLKIQNGELFVLLGPSGCGKTTLLRMLGGFESPDQGEIYLDGKRIDGLPPHQRSIHTVFQNYALFPHLTVWENIAFGPKIQKRTKDQINTDVNEALDIVRMKSFAHAYPNTLSGGQKQRVALARALVNKPKILLLDEPLSALDQKLRVEMQNELVMLQRRLGITFIFVTHDQEEAMGLSDRICILNKGNIQQIGKSEDLYQRPENFFVASFFGTNNKLDLKLSEDNQFLINPLNGKVCIKCSDLNDFERLKLASVQNNERMVHLTFRPEDVKLRKIDSDKSIENENSNDKSKSTSAPASEPALLKVHIDKVIFKGSVKELICVAQAPHANLPHIVIHSQDNLEELGLLEGVLAEVSFKNSPKIFQVES